MRTKIKGNFLRVLATGLAMLATTGGAQAQQSVVDEILANGEMRVGMGTFVPWVMRAKTGEYIGFEVDVAKAVAKDMGVELVMVPTQWDGIIPALLAKKFDVIIGGMAITPERNLKVNFSRPYAEHGLIILAHRELASGMDSMEDFNSPDVVFTLRRGTTPVDAVVRLFPDAKRRLFDEEATALQDVVNGSSTAWVAAEANARAALADNQDRLFIPFEETFNNFNSGIVMRKGDPDAINFFNNWILLRQKSGWLEERHSYWFGSRDWVSLVE